MTPRLSGHISILGLVFFVLKSLLGILRQWSREKFALLPLRLPANGRNNSQHCCANNVGSCCVRVGSGLQTDTTTPNNVGTSSALWEGYNP